MVRTTERWRRGRLYDWTAMVTHLRKKPSAWQLMLPDVPRRTAATVRLQRSPELKLDDGKLEVRIANEYQTHDGQRRCDLFLRYVPNQKENHAHSL